MEADIFYGGVQFPDTQPKQCIAQKVERTLWEREVVGSRPATLTKGGSYNGYYMWFATTKSVFDSLSFHHKNKLEKINKVCYTV